ncbi:MAG: hypothetical protein U9P44_04365 [archaeon]|nr:hypothetical protein [archaeon]
MNTKRILIATAIGLLCGIFCAYGTVMMAEQSRLNLALTTGLLASIIYNRVLIGFAVGLADNIKLNTVLRGAVIGIVITMAMSIVSIVDGDFMSGMTLLAFGAAYGIIADVAATRFSG